MFLVKNVGRNVNNYKKCPSKVSQPVLIDSPKDRTGTELFSQLISFLPDKTFKRLIDNSVSTSVVLVLFYDHVISNEVFVLFCTYIIV